VVEAAVEMEAGAVEMEAGAVETEAGAVDVVREVAAALVAAVLAEETDQVADQVAVLETDLAAALPEEADAVLLASQHLTSS
jgi:hypothetical protein